LQKVKEGGTVYVLLETDTRRDATDTPGGMPQSDNDALTSELRDRLRYVEGQLEAERQAHAEARRIIAGLVERIPAIEAPTDSVPEAPGSSEGAVDAEDRGVVQDRGAGPQEGVQRPWWRRVFGG
jgi:hypothetical protein